MRSVVVVIALSACGRIDFDSATANDDASMVDDASTIDAAPRAPYTVELPLQSVIADLAVLSDGSVVAVGARIGSLTLDGITAPSVGAIDVVVLALGPDGRARWIHQYGGTGSDVADAVAIAPDGSIYVGGFVEDTASLGGPSRDGQGRDAFLAKYGPDGDYVWNVGFGGVDADPELGDMIIDIAVAPDGDVIVVGQVTGNVDFGGGMTPSSGSDFDAFVARYSATGAFRWARRLGASGTNSFVSVVATNDAVYVGGFYSGTPAFNGGTLPGRGGHDALMFRMSGDGNSIVWASNYGGPDNQRIYGLALVDGALVGVGYYWETVDLPGVPASAGRADALVVRYGDPGGAFMGAIRAGGAGCDFLTSAHGSATNVIASGTFEGTVQLDTSVTATGGGADAVAFGVDDTTVLWHRTLGGTTDDLNQGAGGSLETGLVVGGMHGAQLDALCNTVQGASRGYIRRF